MSQTPAPGTGRSGSQNRQRDKSVKIALTSAELAEVLRRVAPSGLSPSSYGRAVLLGTPGPRARRAPPVNAEALARATAALNKAGSNLNQIARALNAGGATVTAQECAKALTEARAAAAAIREIAGRKGQV
jgi:methionine synthase I (cobalamin-dependent)